MSDSKNEAVWPSRDCLPLLLCGILWNWCFSMFLSIISHNWKAAKTQNVTKIIQDPRLFFRASRGFRSPQKTNKQHALNNYIYIICLLETCDPSHVSSDLKIYDVAKPKLKGGRSFLPQPRARPECHPL